MKPRTFVVATYGVTWCCYTAAAFVGRAPSGALSALAITLLYAGTFGPALVAILQASAVGPQGALRALLTRVAVVRAPAWTYVFAVSYVLAIKAIAALAQWVLTGEAMRSPVSWYLFPLAIAVSTPVQFGEELGWRGFLLPSLASRIGYARASVVVGLVWAVWHLPLFVIPDVDLYGQSFVLFALAVVPVSVAMAWLYQRTNRSILLTMLMHSAINQTTVFISPGVRSMGSVWGLHASVFGWTTIGLLWIGALAMLPSLQAQSSRFVEPEAETRLGMAANY